MKYFLGETQEGTKINCEVNSGKLNKFYVKEKGKTREVQEGTEEFKGLQDRYSHKISILTDLADELPLDFQKELVKVSPYLLCALDNPPQEVKDYCKGKLELASYHSAVRNPDFKDAIEGLMYSSHANLYYKNISEEDKLNLCKVDSSLGTLLDNPTDEIMVSMYKQGKTAKLEYHLAEDRLIDLLNHNPYLLIHVPLEDITESLLLNLKEIPSLQMIPFRLMKAELLQELAMKGTLSLDELPNDLKTEEVILKASRHSKNALKHSPSGGNSNTSAINKLVLESPLSYKILRNKYAPQQDVSDWYLQADIPYKDTDNYKYLLNVSYEVAFKLAKSNVKVLTKLPYEISTIVARMLYKDAIDKHKNESTKKLMLD